ncbi:MAG TPA: porin family protein [Bacteroidia bacterium]|nr:porin family protein [Bacteroidia bacterium]
MKKNLVLLALLLVNTQMLFAQRELMLSAEAGGGMRMWYGEKAITDLDDPAFSFTAGLSIRYQFSKNLAVGTAVDFERKGELFKTIFTDNVGTEIGEGKIHYNLDYVTVPLNMIVVFNSRIKPFLSAGPYISYLRNSFLKVDIPNQGIIKTDLDGQYHKFDYGVSFGCGIMIPFGEQLGMSLQLRDNLGLVKIEKSDYYGSSDIKNNTVHLLAGFVYRLKNETSTNRKP